METSSGETANNIFFGTNGGLILQNITHETSEVVDGPTEVIIFFSDFASGEEYGLTISRQNLTTADLDAPHVGSGLSVAEITPLTVCEVMGLSTEQILSFAERIVADIPEQY